VMNASDYTKDMTKSLSPLRSKYAREIEAILEKYPPEQRRSAVMPLLYIAQRDRMYVDRETMGEIGDILGMSTTDVASIVGFYSLYYDEPGGRYHIQVCTDLPCALRGADQFLEELCERLGIRPGETTRDGLITIEEVMCLAACDKAPMFQVHSSEGLQYHENQTVENAMKLIDNLRTMAKRGPGHYESKRSDSDE
jgi:NADH-quinone oxidoreductase subunit E